MDTLKFLDLLHHGGNWAYLWTSEGLRSAWYEPDKPFSNYQSNFDAIDGAKNIHFPVFPLREIPTHNRKGEPAKPLRVRGQIEQVQFGKALFAEFDAKDYGDLGKCAQHIRRLSVEPSIIVFSGGGYHCYWLLTQPVDDIALLQDTQARWVSWVGGDKGAKDIARVLRLPGSHNHKPKYAPDFPLVRIIDKESDPDRRHEIMALRNLLPEKIRATAAPLTPRHSYGDRSTYVARALAQEYSRVATAQQGTRNEMLNKAAYYLGQLIAAPWANVTRLDVDRMLTEAAIAAGLAEDKNCGMTGIARSIGSGVTAGMQVPRREPPTRNREQISRGDGRRILEEQMQRRRQERAQT